MGSKDSVAGCRLVHAMGWMVVIWPTSQLLLFPIRLMFRQGAEQSGWEEKHIHSGGKSGFPRTTPLQFSMGYPLGVPAQPLASDLLQKEENRPSPSG